uniref:Iron-containing alcohol dehydrogenases (Fe-ADH)-like protein n=1 Tax=Coptotermes formosanus TaxID=36987 RepID=R4ULC2_COPFO|nr:iron-containing alcohol dehydrogenases (Fe-ADH)-like protein [Coptotermes formosanus]
MMLGTLEPPSCAYPIGSVLTLSATGSEWNHAFVISKRETQEKMALTTPVTYPLFSLVDPTYQLTLPLRQLRNGVYDAMIHAIDATFVPTVLPLLDDFQLCVLKELIEIGPKVIQSNPSYEFVNRLALAASFACNFLYRSPVKATCFGIHCIGHMLTAKYGIDHGATLSIITCPLLQEFLNERKAILAKAAETIWNATGTTEQKAQACIDNLRKFIAEIGQPLKCSDVEGVVVQEGDVDIITKMVFKSTKGNNLGVNGTITEEITRKILSQVVK